MTSLQTRLTVLVAALALGAVVVLFGVLGRAPAAPALPAADPITWTDLLPDAELRAMAAVEGIGPTSEDEWLMQEASRMPGGLVDEFGRDMGWDASAQPDVAARPREDLDGRRIALSGYMTPLEFEAMETQAFLLVPYVGACIHVPAPPPNQIVFVSSVSPVPVVDMWQPFTAIGTLRVQSLDTGLAETAYVMDLERMVALDTSEGPDADYVDPEM